MLIQPDSVDINLRIAEDLDVEIARVDDRPHIPLPGLFIVDQLQRRDFLLVDDHVVIEEGIIGVSLFGEYRLFQIDVLIDRLQILDIGLFLIELREDHG